MEIPWGFSPCCLAWSFIATFVITNDKLVHFIFIFLHKMMLWLHSPFIPFLKIFVVFLVNSHVNRA